MHMQSVHIDTNILFVLFVFYSGLPPDPIRFKPTSRPCHEARSPYAALVPRNSAQSSPPLPLFPSPLTAPPPLLFHTASLPCSTSMLLAKCRRDHVAPSPSEFRDPVLPLTNKRPAIISAPCRWRRGWGSV
jgi:hypothetical protein